MTLPAFCPVLKIPESLQSPDKKQEAIEWIFTAWINCERKNRIICPEGCAQNSVDRNGKT